MDRYEALLENYRNAWTGLRMVREAIEELGPVGVLPSQEAVIVRYGPEPVHEAQASRGRTDEHFSSVRRKIFSAVTGDGQWQQPSCPTGRD